MALSIKGSSVDVVGEKIVVPSYRCPNAEIAAIAVQRTVFVQNSLVDSDVICQHCIDVEFTGGDLSSKPIQLTGIGNLINFIIAAVIVYIIFACGQHGILVAAVKAAATAIAKAVGIGVVRGIGFACADVGINHLVICADEGTVIDLIAGEVRNIIDSDGLLKNDDVLVFVEQIGHLTRGKLRCGFWSSFAFCTAGVKIVRGRNGIVAIACHTADRATAGDNGAGIIAVINAGEGVTHHTADIAITGDSTCVIAVRDVAAIVLADQAACNVFTGGDNAAVVAFRDVAAVITCHATDYVPAGEKGIDDAYMRNGTFFANPAKQADICSVAVIEVQTAERVSLSVKNAGITSGVAADGHPHSEITSIAVQRTVFVQNSLVDRDVISQHCIDVVFAAVDCCREGVQIIGGADFIVAVAIGVPQRDGCARVNGHGDGLRSRGKGRSGAVRDQLGKCRHRQQRDDEDYADDFAQNTFCMHNRASWYSLVSKIYSFLSDIVTQNYIFSTSVCQQKENL